MTKEERNPFYNPYTMQIDRIYGRLRAEGLSTRAANVIAMLAQSGSPEIVAKLSQVELRRTPNVGKVTINEIQQWLARHDRCLTRRCPHCGGTIP